MAITNGRLRTLDPSARTLTFTYKDYAEANRLKALTLTGVEFNRSRCPPATTVPPEPRNGHAQALSPGAYARSNRLQRGHARPPTPD